MLLIALDFWQKGGGLQKSGVFNNCSRFRTAHLQWFYILHGRDPMPLRELR